MQYYVLINIDFISGALCGKIPWPREVLSRGLNIERSMA
jgi:hypothetical protein